MKKLAFFVALLSGNALADYQVEVELGVGHSEAQERDDEYEYAFNEGYEIFSGAGTYYFAPVKTESVPLSDAAFLGKASSMSLRMESSEPVDIERSSLLAELSWVFDNGLIAGASYASSNQDDEYTDTSVRGPGVHVGYYLSDTSALVLKYENTTYKYDEPDFYLEEPNREIYTLMYKNVTLKGNKAKSDTELLLRKDNDSVELDAKLGWYLNNNIKYGVFAGLQDYDYDYYGDGRTYGLWAEYFPVETISVSAELNKSTSVQYYSSQSAYRFEEQILSFSAKFRF